MTLHTKPVKAEGKVSLCKERAADPGPVRHLPWVWMYDDNGGW